VIEAGCGQLADDGDDRQVDEDDRDERRDREPAGA